MSSASERAEQELWRNQGEEGQYRVVLEGPSLDFHVNDVFRVTGVRMTEDETVVILERVECPICRAAKQ